MFKRVLIANRGEIATRIIRTLKEMGIETIAVYSEADRDALHVLEADRAYFIGPEDPLQSYLNIERILDVARESGALAIHPGYGFLSENPSFSKACEDNGIVFIGPPSNVMESLGDKINARVIAEKAGVDVIPGMKTSTKDLQELSLEAQRLGFPLLIKAALGGGGKGMRIVKDPDELTEACASSIREAEKAFGDGKIYLERLLKRPKHVEFQVLADTRGNVVHLFERECSIQRRHQKIIEETPCPSLSEELRQKMGEAAVKVAKAAGYVNAGTVEFLLEETGRFYFLEVNARLQVEHPITELTTGVDMVRAQLEISWGNTLDLDQGSIGRQGHAIECRIYAEDPAKGFSPSMGKISSYREPKGPWIRVDSGVYEGFSIPMEYDPLISKLIVWGRDREEARRRMQRALRDYCILGITTTIPFLLDLIDSEPFRMSQTHVNLVEECFSSWQPPMRFKEMAALAYILEDLVVPNKKSPEGPLKNPSPWQTLGAWEL